ncbi:MAG: hypothetical protein AAFS07_19130, partial [Pseudomonadota bacterium]
LRYLPVLEALRCGLLIARASPPGLDLWAAILRHRSMDQALRLACEQGVDDLVHALVPVVRVRTCEDAATYPHPAVLQWCLDQGLPMTPGVCIAAARTGSLRVLVLALNHGAFLTTDALREAVRGGHLQLLDWLWRQPGARRDADDVAAFPPMYVLRIELLLHGARRRSDLCDLAAAGGSLRVLAWLRARDVYWSEGTMNAAARCGHLHVMVWARQRGCRWCEDTAVLAARHGHEHVLIWLARAGYPWMDRAGAAAAAAGADGCLRRLRALGVPLDDGALCAAARHGREQTVRCLVALGCMMRARTAAVLSRSEDHYHILRYLWAAGCPWEDDEAVSLPVVRDA